MIKINDDTVYFIDATKDELEFKKEIKKENKYKIVEINAQNRPRVLIDMDDCINNFMNYLCRQYNKQTGKNIKPSDVTDWNVEKFMPGSSEIFKQEGFFEAIPEKRHSVSTLKTLIESTLVDVYVITACGNNVELEEKFKWFDRMLPNFNKDRIIKCKEKEIIRGDVLIDDKVDNLKRCAPYMKCLLFDMAHNQNCQDFPRIKRLKDALPYLDKYFGVKIETN